MELLLCFLSFAIGIGFLYFLYRATFYIKKRWGDFYGAIFVFALWLFFFRDNTQQSSSGADNHKPDRWEFTSQDNVTNRDNGSVLAVLGKNTLSTYNMLVKFGVSKAGHNKVPVAISFIRTGFGDATKLETTSVRPEDADANDKMEYFIEGKLKWKLLGFTVYSEPKSFHGIAVLKCDMPANSIPHEN